MRIRILKGRAAGQVVDWPAPLARQYLNQGLAEEDAMLDPPGETTSADVSAHEAGRPLSRRARSRVRA